MINVYKCNKDCCTYKITPYKQIKWNNGDGWKSNVKKIVKAGSFVIDPETGKILLVQSRGQMWGPPKGTLQDEETVDECAIREVFEETGILLSQSQFLSKTLVKNKAMYYTTEIKEFDISPQNHIKDNDANGIGWFNVECLEQLMKEEKVLINQHCKILLKKFFGKSI